MNSGFFQPSTLVQNAPISTIPRCGACGLFRNCNSPKMPVSGKGERKILLVGEAPGETEDSKGRQFVGKTGQLLEKQLAKHGINMRTDCWLTNSVICRPPKNKIPNDNIPGYCRPNLISTINELKPDIIVPLGGVAVDSLLSWLWKDKVDEISRWVGWQIPVQKINSWVCPIWHPSFVARQYKDSKCLKPEIPLIWDHHLEAISNLEGKPWDKVPDYKKQIQIIFSPEEAAREIDWITNQGGHAAFDYECNAIKPDWDESRVVCCSICWEGKKTISFPWQGPAIPAMIRFLQSPIYKIASNEKFEDRWSMRILKTRVRNWYHDTMNTAHVIDCRRKITSIKFQSFVLLGAESYNDPIEPYLKNKPGSKFNQILKDIEFKQLLMYCGMDSLLEFLVCQKQREILGL